MVILGISAWFHDSAAALVVNGAVVAAVQEERFSRIKNDAEFPRQAVLFCLQKASELNLRINAVAFYEKPFLRFDRLLDTYFRFAPRGWNSFVRAMPLWLNQKLFIKQNIRKNLKSLKFDNAKTITIYFPEHHLSHAASAFFPSRFEEAAILTLDGTGEWATATIAHGKPDGITLLREMRFPHSAGLLYSAFTAFLGFKINSGEYKLMGLAPYGDRNSASYNTFRQTIESQLVRIYPDGSLWLNLEFFGFATDTTMYHPKKWEALFGFSARKETEPIRSEHTVLAAAIQDVTEKIVLRMARSAKEITGSNRLCLAGGVALNCSANGKLMKQKIFEEIFVQPAAGDAGGAIGAALLPAFLMTDSTVFKSGPEFSPFLGPEIDNQRIERYIKRWGLKAAYFPNFEDLNNTVAQRLSEGAICGWAQGKLEFGPRALGNRSILADPRLSEVKEKMNLAVKFRENFRPFAPAVLQEYADNWFLMENKPSPWMQFTFSVHPDKTNPLPKNSEQAQGEIRNSSPNSEIPAVTHVDGTARVQTVKKSDNPLFYGLLQSFFQKTGCPVLLNTSLNIRGEPLACISPDAIRTFLNSEMDLLAVGNFVLEKKDQPETARKKAGILNPETD